MSGFVDCCLYYLLTLVGSFGDISAGVATQCLKSSKCFRAKAQYYANVMLKYVCVCTRFLATRI